MKYYHGTDKYFNDLRLPADFNYKDFGAGVYLAVSEKHAREVAYWKRGAEAYIYAYQVNLTDIKRNFRVLEFKGASLEWLKYVISNRTSNNGHDYDMVIGPTADATVQEEVEKFIRSSKKHSDIEYRQLRDRLKVNIFGTQICIKSQALLDIFNEHRIKETKLR